MALSYSVCLGRYAERARGQGRVALLKQRPCYMSTMSQSIPAVADTKIQDPNVFREMRLNYNSTSPNLGITDLAESGLDFLASR